MLSRNHMNYDFFYFIFILNFIQTDQMSTPSFIATLSSKVVSENASQLGMTRQNTVNPVDNTSSFDIYGRPSALATNYREAVGTDPLYRMCTESSVSRPQYAYYLNPSLGMGEPNQPNYTVRSVADTLTGSSLGRHTQSGAKMMAHEQEGSDDNNNIPYDSLLSGTQKRFSA